MKPLNVRFPDKQKLTISDLSEVIEINTSTIARAALQIGLEQIEAAANKNPYSAATLCMNKAAEAIKPMGDWE